MESFLVAVSAVVLLLLCLWGEQAGMFCKVVGHKLDADGWEGKRIQTKSDSYVEQRWACHWYCIRCGHKVDNYNG